MLRDDGPSTHERAGGRRRPWHGLDALLARRPYVAPLALAGTTVVAAAAAAVAEGLPLRDPSGVFGERVQLLVGTAAVVIAVGVLADARARARRRRSPLGRSIVEVARSASVRSRLGLTALGLVSFYVTYVAYRNLKNYLPVFVDQDLDAPLRDLERWAFLGNDPATLLHDVLGTGVAAHVLSWAYLFYLTFVPVSVAVSLAWRGWTRAGLWYTTALGLNWVLGLVGYYLLPALGPIFAFPGLFDELPRTGVLDLQAAGRIGRDEYQGIAAFPSLHVSVVFTAALIAHVLGVHRAIRWSLWAFLALTLVATIYFGWHYVVDDFAGLLIGAVAAWAGARATGHRIRRGGVPARPAVAAAGADASGATGRRRSSSRPRAVSRS